MKRIYSFGGGSAEGSASDKALLGGKGANLAEMSSLGLPVPPGFTITTAVCLEYLKVETDAARGRRGRWMAEVPETPLPDGLEGDIDAAMSALEAGLDKRFGDADDPLLVSVRSGAAVSMPGMMDTVLNLGLNDTTVEGLARKSGDARFAWDSYRRFVQMYSDVVLGLHRAQLDRMVVERRAAKGVEHDTDLSADDWRELVAAMKDHVASSLGNPFPDDPRAQLLGAVRAVFASWNTTRARFYRRNNDIPDDLGTAVNVQAMVFGNMGSDCATGVAFTRDPKTGARIFFGEFLVNAQGEDVVAGLRTPQPINRRVEPGTDLPTLEEVMPEAYGRLHDVHRTLEAHYGDMQDIEFTIEAGRLWMLQTRRGKRTVAAAVRIAVDMVEEGLISKEEAIRRVDPGRLDQLLHPTVAPGAERTVIAKGLPASPGAATGRVVFTAEEAVKRADRGEEVILVREETSPEDIQGMASARGILTQRGGQTSHAAVVARGMGRCCVVGCSELALHADGSFSVRERTLEGREIRVHEGDLITLDGSTGEVMLGDVERSNPDLEGSGLDVLLGWADQLARLGVRANADTPEDAAVARGFGAVGIGLCRTEHMFFDEGRIGPVRAMILASEPEGRAAALDELFPMQRADFAGIFAAMDGLPVTIRLLDPPLHEFLPHKGEDVAAVAAALGTSVAAVERRIEDLHEFNPMMGHRGCRLGVTHPEIYAMQARAIAEAALDAAADGVDVKPEIMIPLVGVDKELERMRTLVTGEVEAVFEKRGAGVDYLVGTMVELPRACLTADRIAAHADFFSFGTNDLTQTTFGYSRDDARFLAPYQDPTVGILESDPFVTMDRDGVGALVEFGVARGRSTKPKLKVGICGEHGGDPASIAFVDGVGLDYVSCSPYRVPIARLSAARAVLDAAG